MNYGELMSALRLHPQLSVRFVLPDGDPIPADVHLTEVGHVVKTFIDCGGTRRSAAAVVLQLWQAGNDPDHRLTAAKLTSILELAQDLVRSDELNVEVEYEGGALSQYPVSGVSATSTELRFTLTEKHTDCLAKEACGLESSGCSPAEEIEADRCC